ncbi:hypothetical protein JCM8097_006460 [Rhodosporidiobolus ruineniae]
MPYEVEHASTTDLQVSTIAFGWTLGFLCLCISTAWTQTHKLSIYTALIWTMMLDCFIFSVVCWLFLIEKIEASFPFYFAILTLWAFQIQILLQIIINRVNLLWSDHRHQQWLKYGTAAAIGLINVSVYCIWLPARMGISPTFTKINMIWDRCEKCIYLVIDCGLNILFIRVVKARLVDRGLDRYRPLVAFNTKLIVVSVAADFLLIGTMFLKNSFVYLIFHPVSYLIKLQIEMSLGALIVEISSAKPQRGTVANAFEGLKVAVTTHTTTEAFRLDDDGGVHDDAAPVRTTRTPARPDLQTRLAKMRQERQERKDALQREADVRIQMGGDGDRRGSDFSLDEEEKIEMSHWESRSQSIQELPYTPTSPGHSAANVRFVIEDTDKHP